MCEDILRGLKLVKWMQNFYVSVVKGATTLAVCVCLTDLT